MENGTKSRFEELVKREYDKMEPGHLSLVAVSPEGFAVSLEELDAWINRFQNLLYVIGYEVLKETHTKLKKRNKTDERLKLSYEKTRQARAYGVRIKIGQGQLAFTDLTAFQEFVLKKVQKFLQSKVINIAKAEKIRSSLMPNNNAIEEIAIFWKGGGVRL